MEIITIIAGVLILNIIISICACVSVLIAIREEL